MGQRRDRGPMLEWNPRICDAGTSSIALPPDMGNVNSDEQVLPRVGGRPPLSEWQNALAGDPPKILDRLRKDDVLDLYPRCGLRIRERSVLLDTSRVFELCLARIAFLAPRLETGPTVEWLALQVDGALDHAIRQDQRLEDSGVPPDDEDPNYVFLQDALFMHPMLACSAAVGFNNLADSTRHIFFALFDGKSIDQCTEMGLGSRDEIGEAMRRALYAIKYMDPSVRFSRKGKRL